MNSSIPFTTPNPQLVPNAFTKSSDPPSCRHLIAHVAALCWEKGLKTSAPSIVSRVVYKSFTLQTARRKTNPKMDSIKCTQYIYKNTRTKREQSAFKVAFSYSLMGGRREEEGQTWVNILSGVIINVCALCVPYTRKLYAPAAVNWGWVWVCWLWSLC